MVSDSTVEQAEHASTSFKIGWLTAAQSEASRVNGVISADRPELQQLAQNVAALAVEAQQTVSGSATERSLRV